MQSEKIISHPNRIAANCQLANLHLSYCSAVGKLDVIWLVYHVHDADESAALEIPAPHMPRMHKHMFYETHLCLRGWANYLLENNKTLSVKQGEVLFIPPDCRHGCWQDAANLCKISFAFSVSSEDGDHSELQTHLPSSPAVFPSSSEMLSLYLEIIQEVCARRAFYVECIGTLAFRIVTCFARQLESSKVLSAKPLEQKVVDGRVREVMHFVKNHLTEDIAVTDVAQALHLSPKQINRLLQKEFMLNCSEYIEKKKAERAKDLLAFTDMNLDEIATAIGYANSFSFSKFFKRVEGMPPGLFRSSRYKQNCFLLEEPAMNKIPNGVYPVMITPFTAENTIDWDGVDRIVEFYARMGCQGIFAVCLTSEMFLLSEDERVALAARVVKASAGCMCVVASGHVSDALDDQIRELARISQTGVDAVVMIANRLAAEGEDDDVAIGNMRRILDALPNVRFGMYECPSPYRRPLTDRLLEALAESGRFAFIKDTCCDAEKMAHRIRLLDGRVQLFNANAATALESLRAGASGFSGIMANYHPDLYVWLIDQFKAQPEKAEKLSAALSVLSAAEGYHHPVDTKYHMNRIGVPMNLRSRCCEESVFSRLDRHFIDDMLVLEDEIRALLAEK